MTDVRWKFDTVVIPGAQAPGEWKSAPLAPIYQPASHRFDTAEELSDVFAGKKAGFISQRLRNPTNEVLEKRMCMLTGGIDAVVTGSGMAAINNALLAICQAGDEIVSGNSLFMSTFLLFNNVLKKLGITVKLVESGDLGAWKAAVTPRTKALFVETIGNPKMDVPNIRELADLAHANRAPLIVDNTLATPYLFLPIDHGADILAYSTTTVVDRHPRVKWVNFPGLPKSPAHETAKTQFRGKGYGALLTFGLENEKACFDLIRNVKLVYHLANLGDCKTLVIHPWSSQYISFTEESRLANGITPDMLRVSVGIEAIEDIPEGFDPAVRAI